MSWQSVQKKSKNSSDGASRFNKHHSLLRSPEFTSQHGLLYLKPYRVHYKIGPVIPRAWHGKSILQILHSVLQPASNSQQQELSPASIQELIDKNEILVDGYPISNANEILVQIPQLQSEPSANVNAAAENVLNANTGEDNEDNKKAAKQSKKKTKKSKQQQKQQQRQLQQLLEQHKEQQQHYIEMPVVRQEAPILAQEVEFVSISEQLIVINKPASIPAHATSSHYKCAATYILERVYNMGKVYPIHRIDKHTSGIFMCARSSQEAQRLMNILLNKEETTKFYLARVQGNFECVEKTTMLNQHDESNRISLDGVNFVSESVVEVKAPLDTSSQKLVKVDFFKGKPSKSVFYKIKYDAVTNTTLLLCHLFTGRTHQIRVHLQYLGFPIINDCIYGNDAFKVKQQIKSFGEFAETSSASAGQELATNSKKKKCNIVDKYIELLQADEEMALNENKNNIASSLPAAVDDDASLVLVHQLQNLPKRYKKSTYTHFKELSNEELEFYEKKAIKERKEKQSGNSQAESIDCFVMQLHAWKYKLENNTYEAKAPQWAVQLVPANELEQFFASKIAQAK